MQTVSRIFRIQFLRRQVLPYGLIGSLLLTCVAATAMQPDFSLMDVNPASATFNQLVSPRDYLGKTSAWYFGYST